MAKYQNGIQGPLSGKIGNLVACTWKGIPYLRSLPKKRTGKISAAEALNRQRFALAQEWLKPLLPFLRVSYQGYSERVEGYVAAKSYLLKNAMALENGVWKILPEKMLVSYGNLPLAEGITVNFNESKNVLNFRWATQNIPSHLQKDQVMLLAYHEASGQAMFQTTGAFRKTGEDELSIPKNYMGEKFLVYLAFLASDRQSQSDSLFLGEITLG